MRSTMLIVAIILAFLTTGCGKKVPKEMDVETGSGATVKLPLQALMIDEDNAMLKKSLGGDLAQELVFGVTPFSLVNRLKMNVKKDNFGSWNPGSLHLATTSLKGDDCLCWRLLGTVKNGFGVEQRIASIVLQCGNNQGGGEVVMEHPNSCSNLK